MKNSRVQKVLRIIEWFLYASCLVCGILSYDPVTPKWNRLFLPLYLSPLIVRFIPIRGARYGGFCLSFTLIASSLLGLFSDPDFHALKPNINLPNLSTDALGFRVRPPIDYARKKGIRIFAIGGSTTEEINTPDDQTWTHLLQERLKNSTGLPIELINTGYSGARALNHLATLRRVLRWEPDLVIVLVGVNDWNEHIREQFSGSHHPEAFEGNLRTGWRNRMLAKNTVLGRTLIQIKYGYLQRPEVLAVLDQPGSLDRPIRHSFHPAKTYPEYTFFLQQIAKLCKSRDVPCLFLTQPNAYQEGASEELKKSFWMTPPRQPYTLDFESMVAIAKLYNRAMKEFCEEHQHSCYDLASDFAPAAEFFKDDCHFSPKGSKLVAERLTPVVLGLLPEAQANSTDDGVTNHSNEIQSPVR